MLFLPQGAPYLFYQNDSHGNLDAWPNGIAQLTAKGEEQAAKIGEYLRETYRTDLSIDEANQIEIVTTEVMRVRKTAESAFKAFVATTELEKSSQFMPLRMGVVSAALPGEEDSKTFKARLSK